MFLKKGDKPASVVFRDLIFGSLFVFISLVFFVLPFINPETITQDKDISLYGQLHIELIWDSKNNVDVDLIVRGPNGEVVFFRNQNGKIFNLVRDDRGRLQDDTGLNFEHMFSRMLPDGEYVINAYVYSLSEGRLPVNVSLVLNFKKDDRIITENTELIHLNKEQTLIRFYVIDGKISERTISYYHEDLIPEMKFEDEE